MTTRACLGTERCWKTTTTRKEVVQTEEEKEAVSKDVIDFIENGEDATTKEDSDNNNSSSNKKNGLIGAPRDPFVGDEIEVGTYEAVVKIGDNWEIKKGAEGEEEVDGCEAVGSILLALGQGVFRFLINTKKRRDLYERRRDFSRTIRARKASLCTCSRARCFIKWGRTENRTTRGNSIGSYARKLLWRFLPRQTVD